jgi:CRISPR-associated endoribonuclease Cas6
VTLAEPIRFIAMTPIIVRIPRTLYEAYNLDLKHPYEYVFWRQNYPLELFLKQIESNLEKKFINYYNKEPEQKLKFSKLIFKKQISKKLGIRGMVQTIIATFWEFWLDETNELATFGLDAGFGERNSLGFGFLNSNKR